MRDGQNRASQGLENRTVSGGCDHKKHIDKRSILLVAAAHCIFSFD